MQTSALTSGSYRLVSSGSGGNAIVRHKAMRWHPGALAARQPSASSTPSGARAPRTTAAAQLFPPRCPCAAAPRQPATARAAAADHQGGTSSSVDDTSSSTASKGDSNGASYDYDVLVVGGGSAGVRTARVAADNGCRVSLVELPFDFMASADKGGVGGTCVLRGCVPKKLLLFASQFATEAEASRGFGWVGGSPGELHWPSFLAAKRQELLRLNKAYRDNLTNSGVEILEGRGVVVGPHQVEVNGKKFTARDIVIATGGQASRIPIPGAEHAIISDKVLELDSMPSVITLIGGGYIGMEFAGMFARLGCEVHVVARQDMPLAPRFDQEVCKFFMEECQQHAGIHMHMCSNPTSIIKEPDGSLTVKLEPAKKDKDGAAGARGEIRGNSQVVLAVGRAAKTKGLGLEEIGVELGPKGSIKVDEHSRTNIPSIWAVGDVTSRVALTPVAIMEGQALGETLSTGQLKSPSYEAVPSACFSWPYVATVGLTEEQAADKGVQFEVYARTFTPLKANLAARSPAPDNTASGVKSDPNRSDKQRPPQRGFIKLLTEPGSGKLLGMHMVGEDAPEIVQGFTLALKLGATKTQLDSLVGIHPTAAEEVLGLPGPVRTVGKPEQQALGQKAFEQQQAGGSGQVAGEGSAQQGAGAARR